MATATGGYREQSLVPVIFEVLFSGETSVLLKMPEFSIQRDAIEVKTGQSNMSSYKLSGKIKGNDFSFERVFDNSCIGDALSTAADANILDGKNNYFDLTFIYKTSDEQAVASASMQNAVITTAKISSVDDATGQVLKQTFSGKFQRVNFAKA